MKRTAREEKTKLLEQAERFQALRNCGNNHHLTDENGGFKSEHPHEDGNYYSIGYLEDLCQWVTYHNTMSHEEKMKSVLTIESALSRHLSEMGINYIPTWSKKLKLIDED